MNGLDWTEIKTTLEECVRALLPPPAAAPSFEPRWQYGSEGNKFAQVETGWKVFLRVVSVSDVATVRTYVPSTDRLDEQLGIQKRLTMELRCEADFHDDDASRWAVYCVESVKTGLRLRSVMDKLYSSNIAIAEFMDTVDVSLEHDGRWVNAYSTDLAFNVAGCYSTEDLPGDGMDYFDKVLLSSCVLHYPGEDPPDSKLNFTDKLIQAPTT